MKTYRRPLGSVLAVLILFSLLVWSAWAQDASDSGSCCGSEAVQAAQRACPRSGGCPVTASCPAFASGVTAEQTRCPFLNAQINKGLLLESQGKRAYLQCPRREGAFGQDPQKSRSIRPQFSI